MNGFYVPPGGGFSPGDVFRDIPVSILKFPLSYFRMRPGQPPDYYTAEERPAKEGDSARGSLLLRWVMLLSNGCDIDNLTAKQSQERRHWLVAPIEPFANLKTAEAITRTREGRQPNRFYLPSTGYLGAPDAEHFVELRKIMPVNMPYFRDELRVCSLSQTAQLALQGHIGMFFSGLVLYVQPIACPQCGSEVDPKNFLVPSEDGAEED